MSGDADRVGGLAYDGDRRFGIAGGALGWARELVSDFAAESSGLPN